MLLIRASKSPLVFSIIAKNSVKSTAPSRLMSASFTSRSTSALVGAFPAARSASPSSAASMVPLPSLSKETNVALYSASCSSDTALAKSSSRRNSRSSISPSPSSSKSGTMPPLPPPATPPKGGVSEGGAASVILRAASITLRRCPTFGKSSFQSLSTKATSAGPSTSFSRSISSMSSDIDGIESRKYATVSSTVHVCGSLRRSGHALLTARGASPPPPLSTPS
mmetsp:Transcript_35378/g.92543  ORF Transcript_35378/g.92543 Transcript_35378/m.92543 type:complete len:224 (-) Transcript_35378:117-788(-)